MGDAESICLCDAPDSEHYVVHRAACTYTCAIALLARRSSRRRLREKDAARGPPRKLFPDKGRPFAERSSPPSRPHVRDPSADILIARVVRWRLLRSLRPSLFVSCDFNW
ncbi:hypothetical protein MTO96_012797 [Rhipicephalus appendiculatus]